MPCQPSTKTNATVRRAPGSGCSATSACTTAVSRCMPLCKRQRLQRRRGGRVSSSAFSPTVAIKNATRKPLAVLTSRKHGLNSVLVPSTTTTKKIKSRRTLGMKARPTPLDLGLPKSLPRPARREVSKEALVAADPGLAGVEPQYVRECLSQIAPSMLMDMADVKVVSTPTPMKGSQSQLSVIQPNPDAITPSHILAIYSRPSSSSQEPASPVQSVAPIHSIVLAAHCASLPPMAPPSSSRPSADPRIPIALPIQPLCLPSTSTFPILSGYLYHKRTDILLSQLLPTPPPVGCEYERIAELGQSLARECGGEKVVESMRRVHGVWSNAFALGVVDEAMWDTLDFAWSALCIAREGTPSC